MGLSFSVDKCFSLFLKVSTSDIFKLTKAFPERVKKAFNVILSVCKSCLVE